VVLGEQGEIEWWNKAAESLLGVLRQRDYLQPITQLIQDPEFIHWFENSESNVPLEIPSPVKESQWLTLHSGCTAKQKRLLQVRDTTRLHQLKQMRRDFVSNVSHELRTPLTVISGYIESLLDMDEIRNGPWHGMISQISNQSQRMQRIVDDLLMLSRLELNEERPLEEIVSIDALLKRIRADAVALSGDRQHRIEIEANPELGLIGNASDLRSAFSNLVFNAVRYTPPHGVIKMQWSATKEGASFIVSDTGIGIEAHHLPRLTERFYRVDVSRSRQNGGTGLGLAIVKHVLNRHDGELNIESEVGTGSTFSCRFPSKRVQLVTADAADG
jgi:two-component system phosphate regulon sensor histidine kinase PhoR